MVLVLGCEHSLAALGSDQRTANRQKKLLMLASYKWQLETFLFQINAPTGNSWNMYGLCMSCFVTEYTYKEDLRAQDKK